MPIFRRERIYVSFFVAKEHSVWDGGDVADHVRSDGHIPLYVSRRGVHCDQTPTTVRRTCYVYRVRICRDKDLGIDSSPEGARPDVPSIRSDTDLLDERPGASVNDVVVAVLRADTDGEANAPVA